MSVNAKKIMLGAGAGGAAGGSYIALMTKSGNVTTLDHTTPGTVSVADTLAKGGGGDDGFAAQFSSDASFIVATTEAGQTLHLINSSNPASLSSDDDVTVGFRPRDVALTPDDAYVAVGHWNSNIGDTLNIKVYSISSGSLSLSSTTTIPNSGLTGGSIESLDFSPDGNYLVAIGKNDYNDVSHVWLYSHSSGSLTFVDSYSPGAGNYNLRQTIRFSPDGSVIAAAQHNDLRLFTYDASSITFQNSQAITGSGVFYGLSWRPDGTQLASCAGGNKRLHVYNISGSSFSSSGPTFNFPEVSYNFAYSPGGNYIACQVDNATSFNLLDSSSPSSLSSADTIASSVYYTTGARMSWSSY
jgi:hypothetical protein